jgi:hypothetical protein
MANPARAIVNPVGLGVVAGAATVAIALTNPLVAVIGGGVYAVTVGIDLWRRLRTKKAKRSAIVGMKDPSEIKDPETRAAVQRLIDNKRALQAALDDAPPEILVHLSHTIATLDELESNAIRLVERAEDITRFLAGVNLPALVGEVKQLATRAISAKDPTARASFEEAKQAKMDQIRSLKDMRATKERIDANLMRVVAILGVLPTKVAHMRALDDAAMDQISGDIRNDLDIVGNELKTSEKVIREQLVAQ